MYVNLSEMFLFSKLDAKINATEDNPCSEIRPAVYSYIQGRSYKRM
jgi:hypothetical protein